MKKGLWALLLAPVLGSAAWAQAQNVFITNPAANTVSVADAGTLVLLPNTAAGGPNPIAVGQAPTGCISDLQRNLIYVLNSGAAPVSVSVIDSQRFKVINTVTIANLGSPGGMTTSQDNRW